VPLNEKVKFEAKLQRGNRVQIPKMVRWRFKLESFQVLEVTVSFLAVWGNPKSFFTRMSKDGRIAIPKKTLALLRQDKSNVEGYMMAVTLAPS
jgi:bifunctional DNA-binding transcriptional regulator/antitoxin component of YhaV-PrlF toxin-antitoxin module